MDWEAAIDRNREALLSIVTALFAMAGLDDEFLVVATLPRYAYRAILLVLRPAEAAVRRLIVIAARGLTVTLRPPRASSPNGGEQPVCQRQIHRAGGTMKGQRTPGRCGAAGTRPGGQPIEPQAKQAGRMRGSDAPARIPAFQLIDPRKRFTWLYENAASATQPPRDAGASTGNHPLAELQPVDDYHIAPDRLCTRLGLRGTLDSRADDAGPVRTIKLCLRLRALKAALGDIPAQARRLARLQAQRERDRTLYPNRPWRLPPMRPGLPPGHRKRRVHEIDAILRECHTLAHYALAPPGAR